jgi:hypothetical protein
MGDFDGLETGLVVSADGGIVGFSSMGLSDEGVRDTGGLDGWKDVGNAFGWDHGASLELGFLPVGDALGAVVG